MLPGNVTAVCELLPGNVTAVCGLLPGNVMAVCELLPGNVTAVCGLLPGNVTAVCGLLPGNLTACQYQRATQDESTLLVVTYVMAAVCLVCALPLAVVLVQWQVRRIANRRRSPPDPEAQTVLTDSK